MLRAAVVVLAILSVPLPAAAEAPPRDEDTATALAIGATALGGLGIAAARADRSHADALGLAGVGLLIVGPSAGHIYAGEGQHAAWLGLIRFAGVEMAVGGWAATYMSPDLNGSCVDCDVEHHQVAALVGIAGVLVYTGATVYDLADAHRAARRRNARSLEVVPTILPATGAPAAGLAVVGSF